MSFSPKSISCVFIECCSLTVIPDLFDAAEASSIEMDSMDWRTHNVIMYSSLEIFNAYAVVDSNNQDNGSKRWLLAYY